MVTTASTYTANIIMMVFMLAIIFVGMVVSMTGIWRTYIKLGFDGWKGIIPVYNTVLLCEYFFNRKLMGLLVLIPVVNIVLLFMIYNKISETFGKYKPFTLGLFFFNPVFMAMLGFSKEYEVVRNF